MPLSYADFLASKQLIAQPMGLDIPRSALSPVLYDWQQALVHWCLQRGRAGLFASTGLGKTLQQCEWARHIPGRVLIFAPLAVTQQTIAEAHDKLGMPVQYVRRPQEMGERVCITNYDLLDHFCDIDVAGIVLDESSCLKGITSKRRELLFRHFTHIPYRLCCTATPAPNDIAEIAMHAEFLGIMTRTAVLATFFVHDNTGWRLRGHAQDAFYRWLSSWAMALRSPADIGFDGSAFALPPLIVQEHALRWDGAQRLADGDGQLGLVGSQKLHGITDRINVRKETISLRAEYTAALIRTLWLQHQNTSENITSGTEKLSCNMNEPAQRSALLKNENDGFNIIESGMQETKKSSEQSSKKNVPSALQKNEQQERHNDKNITREIKRPFVPNNVNTLETGQKSSAPLCLNSITSPSTNMRASLLPSMDVVLSAVPMDPNSEKEASTSIITILQAESEDCSANHATLVSENSTITQPSSAKPLNTSNGMREKWVVWCGLDAEQQALERLLGGDCISIYGSLSHEEKERREHLWRTGDIPVIITKAKIFGWGINWQCCHNQVFLGINDSQEMYYQAVRRLWRYGQTNTVTTHVVLSEHERPIWENVQRKEQEALQMIDGLIEAMKGYEQAALGQCTSSTRIDAVPMRIPLWLVPRGTMRGAA